MNAPVGTVVNCTHPARGRGRLRDAAHAWSTLIFKALAPAIPERRPGGDEGDDVPRRASAASTRHAAPYYCFLETLAGGYGGRDGSDGPDAVQTHGQNTENAPIEETELNYPVRIARYELVEDSEGPGRWRGGLGVRRDYLFPDEPADLHDPRRPRPAGARTACSADCPAGAPNTSSTRTRRAAA